MSPRGPRGEILVTGAAGFVGSHIARACQAAGWPVVGLDVRPLPPEVRDLTRPVRGGADDIRVLTDVRAGRYLAVIHQAAVTNTLEKDWGLLSDVNIRQPLALADACAAAGIPFFYASSHSVYGKINKNITVVEGAERDATICSGPLNLYARSKLELDNAMDARGIDTQTPWIGLRYTNVFGTGESHKGNMASIISQILRKSALGRPIRLFADTLAASRDYVPVEVVTDTILRLLARPIPSGIYNLGSGRPISFATLLAWCTEFTDAPPAVRLEPNPISTRYQYWTCADVSSLRRHLPDLPQVAVADVKAAAHRLFQRFRTEAA